MTRNPLHTGFSQRLAAYLGVVLIVFSFQANYELADSASIYVIYYSLLLICIVVILYRIITPVTFCMIVLGVSASATVVGPLKALGMVFAMPFGYYVIKYQRPQIEIALVCIFFVNFVVVFAQFIGWSEAVYQFCHYSNEAVYRSFIEHGLSFSGFLPQIRPSGIFPSPTYVSSFCVLFFALVLVTCNYRNRVVFFLFGIHMAMLGSTAGLCLFIISIPLIKVNMRLGFLALGYIIMLVLYTIYLPEQFAYNFNYSDIGLSFYSRFDLANTDGEGLLQRNLFAFFLLCLVFFIGMLNVKRIAAFISLIPFAISLMLPALVHDVFFTLFYWFLVGGAFGTLVTETSRRNMLVKGLSHLSYRKVTKRSLAGKMLTLG